MSSARIMTAGEDRTTAMACQTASPSGTHYTGPVTPQNIYDDPAFFAGYSTLERFGAGWERAAELADLLALLPEIDSRRVLDLGCGAGQLARHLATMGAADVVGVDVSERMLALARAEWAH